VFKDFLVKKKKLQMPTDRDRATKADKLDKIILLNMDKGGEEIIDKSGYLIEANTKVVVRRLPMKELDPVELSYNQMQNSLTKIKELRRLGLDKSKAIEQMSDEKSDTEQEEENVVSEHEEDEEGQNDAIESYSIDLKYLDKEFRCPMD
jgi:uncharacterized protein YoaH (UPF0181 family)